MWILGITVQEIKKVQNQGMVRYLGEWWHLAIIPMIASYILAAGLWIAGYAIAVSDLGSMEVNVQELHFNTSLVPYRLLLLSNSFYALAFVLTFLEVSHFFQVNSILGPLHLSLMMMTKDIVRFLALFGLNFCAFSLALRKLYTHDVQMADSNLNSTQSHTFQK